MHSKSFELHLKTQPSFQEKAKKGSNLFSPWYLHYCKESCPWGSAGQWKLLEEFSPLIYKDEFPIYGVPGHVFRGLHPDLAVHRLRDHVGMEPSDGNKAA